MYTIRQLPKAQHVVEDRNFSLKKMPIPTGCGHEYWYHITHLLTHLKFVI